MQVETRSHHQRKFANNSRPPSGHECPMASMISHKDIIRIQMMDGDVKFGLLTHFDKWSLTVEVENENDSTIVFKHAISNFRKYQRHLDYVERINRGGNVED